MIDEQNFYFLINASGLAFQISQISHMNMIIVIIAIYLMIYLQKRKIVSFDESNDSTEDYSIEIKVRK